MITAGILFLLVVIDQAIKYAFRADAIHGYPPISSITSPTLALTITSITILGLLLALRYVKPSTASFGITIILAGGISNIIDLITRGFAVDIINLAGLHFNIGDVYIITGSALVFSTIIFGTPKES